MPGHSRRHTEEAPTGGSSSSTDSSSNPALADMSGESTGMESGEGTGEEGILASMMSSSRASTVEPEWSKTDAKAIQRQLRRIGLYKLGIDGAIGKGSKAGLVEAFGGDQWRIMSAADVLAKLTAVKTRVVTSVISGMLASGRK